MIRDSLVAIAAHGEPTEVTNIDRIALALLAGIQGGLLLSQVRRDTAPLEAAMDTMIEYLSRLGMR
jgi:TetR/AcrR family transcriptional regulator, transcriptional repressor for nem operon